MIFSGVSYVNKVCKNKIVKNGTSNSQLVVESLGAFKKFSYQDDNIGSVSGILVPQSIPKSSVDNIIYTCLTGNIIYTLYLYPNNLDIVFSYTGTRKCAQYSGSGFLTLNPSSKSNSLSFKDELEKLQSKFAKKELL